MKFCSPKLLFLLALIAGPTAQQGVYPVDLKQFVALENRQLTTPSQPTKQPRSLPPLPSNDPCDFGPNWNPLACASGITSLPPTATNTPPPAAQPSQPAPPPPSSSKTSGGIRSVVASIGFCGLLCLCIGQFLFETGVWKDKPKEVETVESEVAKDDKSQVLEPQITGLDVKKDM